MRLLVKGKKRVRWQHRVIADCSWVWMSMGNGDRLFVLILQGQDELLLCSLEN